MGNTVSLISSIVSDYLNASGFVAASTASAGGTIVWKALMQKRVETARDILLDELRQGAINMYELPPEDAASMTYCYMRAATEGAARRNLRLLAAVVRGQLHIEKLHYADEFLRWSDILATLTREEVYILSALIRHNDKCNAENVTIPVWHEVVSDLSESIFIKKQSVNTKTAALLRTGLVDLHTGFYGGGEAFTASQLLLELNALVCVEEVLKRSRNADEL